MTILNLTQHNATPDQIKAGVVEPKLKANVQNLLTFETIPSYTDVHNRANTLAAIAADEGCKKVMIGGAPFLMPILERYLIEMELQPVYAFSAWDRVDEPDGSDGIRKVIIVKHAGFVEVPMY